MAFQKGGVSWNKGRRGVCLNTGRTHFKKGFTPWNKGKHPGTTPAMRAAYDQWQGLPRPKPTGFSETMRKVNPPRGIKYMKGYRWLYLPDHPDARKKPPNYGYIAEHRLVMERHRGRRINHNGVHGEQIHHLDGDKSNNAIENLVLCSTVAEHSLIHNAMEKLVREMIKAGEVTYDQKAKTFIRPHH